MGNDVENAAGVPKEAILHVSTQVRLAKEDIFFGPGKARLMEYIEKTGSMQEACLEMGLSYYYSTLHCKLQEMRSAGRREEAGGRSVPALLF